MDLKILMKDDITNDKHDNTIIDVVVKERVELSLDHIRDEIKITNFLSSRMELMNEEFGERDDKKSLFLLSRQYPAYRHYSHRGGKLNQLRLSNKYRILPEIRGQNLFGGEKERSDGDENDVHVKVANGRMDTLQQLQSSILRYGSNGENVWMGFTEQKYQHKLVRPGFSARRYLANLARNLNETLVKKLMCDGYILEKNLFTSNSVMPHIRRRLSDDLSRFPEPYRILKQMLMAPGPLNEFSFIWGRKSMIYEEGLFQENPEMEKGDIKILFKKEGKEGEEEFEEVQYSELSGPKKKTILSNLLVKSAMNHALRIKEEMMEYSESSSRKRSRNTPPNLHIPVIKFNMKEAIAELLTKETLQTLTTTQMEFPFIEGPVNDKFKGRGLRGPRYRPSNLVESVTKIDEAAPSIEVVNPSIPVKEDKELEMSIPQNLTLRLNQTHFQKTKLKRKVLKSESTNGKESVSSDPSVPHILLNPSDDGINSINTKDRETQGNAFAEMIKKKAEMAATRKENVLPYGKYRDQGLSILGDIDPATSFSNWKYKEDHIQSSITESGQLTKSEATTVTRESNLQARNDHSRLVNLLRGQADEVAHEVLARTDGGVDFASDVNVAIRNILGQTQGSGAQVWNLEVENLKNEADYQGVIKDIFKSIFKDELQSLGGHDLEVSPSLMKLLQSGFNLKLENIEMVSDPDTGRLIAVLKKGVQIPEGIKKVMKTTEVEGRRSPVVTQTSNVTYKVGTEEATSYDERGIIKNNKDKAQPSFVNRTLDYKSIVVGDVQNAVPLSISDDEVVLLQRFIKENSLVEKEGLLYDKDGGYYDKEGKYYDQNRIIVESKSVAPKHITMAGQLTNMYQDVTRKGQILGGGDLIQRNVYNTDNIHGEQVTIGDSNDPVKTVTNETYYQPGQQIEISESKNEISMNKDGQVLTHLDPINNKVIDHESSPINKDDRLNKDSKGVNSKVISTKSKSLSKSSVPISKVPDKERKISTNKKKNPKKKEFIFGLTDETKETMKLYNKAETSNLGSIKSKQSEDNKKKTKKMKDEGKHGKETDGNTGIVTISTDNSALSADEQIRDNRPEDEEEGGENNGVLPSDEEIFSDEMDEAKRLKMIKRQERLNQRKAEVQRQRKEEELRRRKDEEDRKMEGQRISLEETVKKRLEEERKRKEDEFLLLKEKEKEEEQALLDAEKRKEYFHLRQIEKERQQKEEFARRKEEVKIRQALEEKLRKEEQEMREIEEAAMLARLNEEQRREYMRKKAELLEKQRLEEEEERKVKEENARLALEEAKLIAKQQAIEKKLMEERQRMKIEDEGLKKYLNVSPAFVWSYFEFLNMLGVNDDSSIVRLQSNNNRD